MQLRTIGTGNAFTKKNWQSNFLLTHNNKNLLVDCGSYCWLAAEEMGLTTADVDAVFISHIHADHVGGLEELAFTTCFNPALKRPTLFCEGSYERIDGDDSGRYTSGLVKQLWDSSLSGGLRGIEGKRVHLDHYFDVKAVESNGSFVWEGIKFDIVQTVHVSSKYQIEHSFGLMWNDPDTGERVYLTTDTQFCPINAINAYFKEADHIFHDCETSPFASGVHAHYNNLKTLSPEVKEKIWLYHYQDNVINNWEEMNQQAIKDGFRGFVPTHTIFDRSYKEYSIGMVGKKSIRQ